MTPTLQTFARALLTPDLSFKTLADARAATGADGLPRLMRTTRFAEAEITWRGRQWLLSMPLSPAALASVERTASQLGRLNTDHLAEYRILRDELRWTDPAGRERRFDLALQHLPAGKPFAEALHTEPAERLLAALDVLIDGRYLEAERSLSLVYRGSANQRILDVQKSLAAGRAVEHQSPRWRGEYETGPRSR